MYFSRSYVTRLVLNQREKGVVSRLVAGLPSSVPSVTDENVSVISKCVRSSSQDIVEDEKILNFSSTPHSNSCLVFPGEL